MHTYIYVCIYICTSCIYIYVYTFVVTIQSPNIPLGCGPLGQGLAPKVRLLSDLGQTPAPSLSFVYPLISLRPVIKMLFWIIPYG